MKINVMEYIKKTILFYSGLQQNSMLHCVINKKCKNMADCQ